MAYPRLEINLKKLYHNAKMLVEQCKAEGIAVAGVTKVFCGDPIIAQVLIDGGIAMLADSRIQNLKKLQTLSVPKMLLRIPMLSEVEEMIEYADISLQSELAVIEKTSRIALEKGKDHHILLMVDLGDLREGCWEDEIYSLSEKIVKLGGVKLSGIGTNFGCYGGVIPEDHSLQRLVEIKNKVEENCGITLEIVSGGNSNSLHLLWENKIPKEVNQLRLGEPIVLGKEDVYDATIEGFYDNGFRLWAEIIEIKSKPSVPIGKIGVNAFGYVPTFENRGIRKRAIVALGRQDILLDGISPVEKGVLVLGASSDHLLLDIEEMERELKIGDILEFKMNYGALLAAMTSPYVHKIYVK
ncbi:MAG: ornithine racemase Orr [Thermotaleaceae bacterium]